MIGEAEGAMLYLERLAYPRAVHDAITGLAMLAGGARLSGLE